MALTATGSIFVDESLPAIDSNPSFTAPDLEVTWTTAQDNSISATLFILNSDATIVLAATYKITTSEISGITLTTSGLQNQMREAVEKVVRNRLNTLNGATVITWS